MDYVAYLKTLRMIGQFAPMKKDDGGFAEALLVSVEIALQECNGWSNQDLTRSEFLNCLKDNDILVFSNIEDFVNWKKEKSKPSEGRKKFKRVISEERRNQLKKHAELMREKIRPTISEKS